MNTPVILPDIGAGPVVLSAWFADPGDQVFEGDRLVEVLVGGATFDVSAPATGRLTEKRAREYEWQKYAHKFWHGTTTSLVCAGSNWDTI